MQKGVREIINKTEQMICEAMLSYPQCWHVRLRVLESLITSFYQSIFVAAWNTLMLEIQFIFPCTGENVIRSLFKDVLIMDGIGLFYFSLSLFNQMVVKENIVGIGALPLQALLMALGSTRVSPSPETFFAQISNTRLQSEHYHSFKKIVSQCKTSLHPLLYRVWNPQPMERGGPTSLPQIALDRGRLQCQLTLDMAMLRMELIDICKKCAVSTTVASTSSSTSLTSQPPAPIPTLTRLNFVPAPVPASAPISAPAKARFASVPAPSSALAPASASILAPVYDPTSAPASSLPPLPSHTHSLLEGALSSPLLSNATRPLTLLNEEPILSFLLPHSSSSSATRRGEGGGGKRNGVGSGGQKRGENKRRKENEFTEISGAEEQGWLESRGGGENGEEEMDRNSPLLVEMEPIPFNFPTPFDLEWIQAGCKEVLQSLATLWSGNRESEELKRIAQLAVNNYKAHTTARGSQESKFTGLPTKKQNNPPPSKKYARKIFASLSTPSASAPTSAPVSLPVPASAHVPVPVPVPASASGSDTSLSPPLPHIPSQLLYPASNPLFKPLPSGNGAPSSSSSSSTSAVLRIQQLLAQRFFTSFSLLPPHCFTSLSFVQRLRTSLERLLNFGLKVDRERVEALGNEMDINGDYLWGWKNVLWETLNADFAVLKEYASKGYNAAETMQAFSTHLISPLHVPNIVVSPPPTQFVPPAFVPPSFAPPSFAPAAAPTPAPTPPSARGSLTHDLSLPSFPSSSPQHSSIPYLTRTSAALEKGSPTPSRPPPVAQPPPAPHNNSVRTTQMFDIPTFSYPRGQIPALPAPASAAAPTPNPTPTPAPASYPSSASTLPFPSYHLQGMPYTTTLNRPSNSIPDPVPTPIPSSASVSASASAYRPLFIDSPLISQPPDFPAASSSSFLSQSNPPLHHPPESAPHPTPAPAPTVQPPALHPVSASSRNGEVIDLVSDEEDKQGKPVKSRAPAVSLPLSSTPTLTPVPLSLPAAASAPSSAPAPVSSLAPASALASAPAPASVPVSAPVPAPQPPLVVFFYHVEERLEMGFSVPSLSTALSLLLRRYRKERGEDFRFIFKGKEIGDGDGLMSLGEMGIEGGSTVIVMRKKG